MVYLESGGTLEKAAQMANRASTRTTQLYDGGPAATEPKVRFGET
jgi:hypothetical protein